MIILDEKTYEKLFWEKVIQWNLFSITEKYARDTLSEYILEHPKEAEEFILNDDKDIKLLRLKLSLSLCPDTYKSEDESFYISIVYGYFIKERYVGYYCCFFDYETAEIFDDILYLGEEMPER